MFPQEVGGGRLEMGADNYTGEESRVFGVYEGGFELKWRRTYGRRDGMEVAGE